MARLNAHMHAAELLAEDETAGRCEQMGQWVLKGADWYGAAITAELAAIARGKGFQAECVGAKALRIRKV